MRKCLQVLKLEKRKEVTAAHCLTAKNHRDYCSLLPLASLQPCLSLSQLGPCAPSTLAGGRCFDAPLSQLHLGLRLNLPVKHKKPQSHYNLYQGRDAVSCIILRGLLPAQVWHRASTSASEPRSRPTSS
eukprot:2796042-Rhodomonas_salina.1